MLTTPICRSADALTCFADAPAIRENAGIRLGKFVSASAMSYVASQPPAHVFGQGDWFKVVGIDAFTDTAEVVQLQAVWDGSLVDLIDNAVRFLDGARSAYLAIPTAIRRASPNPAGRGVTSVLNVPTVLNPLLNGQRKSHSTPVVALHIAAASRFAAPALTSGQPQPALPDGLTRVGEVSERPRLRRRAGECARRRFGGERPVAEFVAHMHRLFARIISVAGRFASVPPVIIFVTDRGDVKEPAHEAERGDHEADDDRGRHAACRTGSASTASRWWSGIRSRSTHPWTVV